jgi:hypothetical protein
MKFEPFGALIFTAALGTVGVAKGNADTILLLASVLLGGTVAGAWSVLKSRKKRASSTDTALWAYIAMIGSMGLAFFAAPYVAHRQIDLGDVGSMTMPDAPLLAFIFATGGAPIIEKLASGWLLQQIEKINPLNRKTYSKEGE